jgi:hypothetical protein
LRHTLLIEVVGAKGENIEEARGEPKHKLPAPEQQKEQKIQNSTSIQQQL